MIKKFARKKLDTFGYISLADIIDFYSASVE